MKQKRERESESEEKKSPNFSCESQLSLQINDQRNEQLFGT